MGEGEKRWWTVRRAKGSIGVAMSVFSHDSEGMADHALKADDNMVATYWTNTEKVGRHATILEAIQQDPGAFGLDPETVLVPMTRADAERILSGTQGQAMVEVPKSLLRSALSPGAGTKGDE